jgi:hypothetical protein
MTLEERFKTNPPDTSKAYFKGGDPEIIGFENEYGPSLNKSKDEQALKSGRNGEIGGGSLNAAGYKPGKPYSDKHL